MVKLILAILLVVLAYKAYGWFRSWQARQEIAAAPPTETLGPGVDLRRCSTCDRYVAASAIAECRRSDCPMKG